MSNKQGRRKKDGLLLEACLSGSLSEVKQLLADGANINLPATLRSGAYRDPVNDTDYFPVHFAINSGRTEVALYLINAGCKLVVQHEWGAFHNKTIHAINLAAQKDNVTILKALIQKGCDINSTSNYDQDRTPLHMAIEAKSDASVYCLVEAGADTTKGSKRRSPLHIAAKQGSWMLSERYRSLMKQPKMPNND